MLRHYSSRASMMLDRHQRRSAMVHRQYLEQHMDHRCVGLVEYRVIDVTGLEKEVAGTVDACLLRQNVRHIAGGHLPDTGTDMIVLTNITPGCKREFGDPKLVLSVDLGQEAADGRLKFDLGNQAF